MEDRLLSLLERVLGNSKKTTGNNYAFFSPFKEHYKPKLEINIGLNSEGKNPWHCWISDEKGKSIRSLFKKLKVSKEVWEEHNSIFSRKYKYTNHQATHQATHQVVQLPKEYIPLWKPSNSIIRKHALQYLNGRGVTPHQIIKYEMGYCESGIYQNKIIIPSYDKDARLNYFVGRSFYDTPMKHKNPDVSKDIIGFEMMINWDYDITIVEGSFDAIAIRMNAIPIFGKSIQSKLYFKILKKKPPVVNICLDTDARRDALKLAENFINNDICVRLVELPDNRDVSELGFDVTHDLIKNTKLTTFSDIIRMKIGNI